MTYGKKCIKNLIQFFLNCATLNILGGLDEEEDASDVIVSAIVVGSGAIGVEADDAVNNRSEIAENILYMSVDGKVFQTHVKMSTTFRSIYYSLFN